MLNQISVYIMISVYAYSILSIVDKVTLGFDILTVRQFSEFHFATLSISAFIRTTIVSLSLTAAVDTH